MASPCVTGVRSGRSFFAIVPTAPLCYRPMRNRVTRTPYHQRIDKIDIRGGTYGRQTVSSIRTKVVALKSNPALSSEVQQDGSIG